jgi:Protein of unknown function (DUF1326)
MGSEGDGVRQLQLFLRLSCQFNALPTHGNCRYVAGFQIEQGHFGDVKLDGLRAVTTHDRLQVEHLAALVAIALGLKLDGDVPERPLAPIDRITGQLLGQGWVQAGRDRDYKVYLPMLFHTVFAVRVDDRHVAEAVVFGGIRRIGQTENVAQTR